MAVEPQKTASQRSQALQTPDLAPRPPVRPVIDLDIDPFGEIGEGGQVAGTFTQLLREIFKRRPVQPPVDPEKLKRAEDAGTLIEPPGPVIGGSTRSLPNVRYYEDKNTKRVLELYEQHQQPRPVQTWEQTRERAESAEVLAELSGKKVSDGWRAEHVKALRNQLTLQSGALTKLDESLMRKIEQGIDPSPEELAEFALKAQQLHATHQMVSGVSSDLGRALNILREMSGPRAEADYYAQIARIIDEGGGADVIKEKIKAVARAGRDPKKVLEAVQETWPAKTWKAILLARYNLMLSSVRTHAANVLGSTGAGIYETVVINPMAKAINYAERTGRRFIPGRAFTEAGDITTLPWIGAGEAGLLRGAIQGAKLFGRMAAGLEVPPGSYQGKFANDIGVRYKPQDIPKNPALKAATTPTRLLEAEDAFFRSAFYEQRLWSLAHSEATARAGSDKAAFDKLFPQLLENPTDEMKAAAKEYSQRLTFTNDPSLYGKYLQGLAQGAEKFRQWGPMHLLLPFVRTPANLFGYTLEQAGYGMMLGPNRTWQAIKGNDPRVRAEALARVNAAVGMHFLLYQYWQDGRITGVGSPNFRERRVMEATGWRQNAAKFGDEYYELNRFDPMGSTVGMVASTFDLFDDQNLKTEDKVAASGAVILQLADMMLDRSYLSSLGQLLEALDSGSIKQASALVASTGQSMFLPNVARDFREAEDPYRRELAFDPRQGVGMLDRLQKGLLNALPHYSRELPLALDWKGDPIKSAAGPLWRALVPIRVTDFDNIDNATRELVLNNVTPSKPDALMSIPKSRGVYNIPLLSLDDGKGHIYSYYQQLVGTTRHKAVTTVVNSRDYQRAVLEGDEGTPDSTAGLMLRRAMDRATMAAKSQMLKDLFEGRTVTLYPDREGAEISVQLPKIDQRQLGRSIEMYFFEPPERRGDVTVPEGVLTRPKKSRPAIENVFERPERLPQF